MLCRLCLLDCDDLLEVFDEDGLRMRIGSIVAQHFGFQFKHDDQISDKICTTCWMEVENFHTFFLDVRRAQDKLRIELEKNVDPDPDTDEDICEDDEYDSSGNDLEDYGSDPSIFQANINCDNSYLRPGWKDTSNVTGDIDVFAAPSRTLSKNCSSRKVHSREYPDIISSAKNRIIVVDIGSSKYNNNEDEISSFYSAGQKSCNGVQDENEFIRNRFKSLGIPGLTKILERNELSITAVPKDDIDSMKEGEEEISKYIQLNCELCEEKFKTFSDLKHHFRIAHNIIGYVVCCNEKLFQPVHLVNHIMKHLDRSRFATDAQGVDMLLDTNINNCLLCQEVFEDKQQLNQHLIEHFRKKSTRVQCQQCGLWCKTRYILRKHARTHLTEGDDQICTICGKKFPSDIALQRHLTNVHYKERKFQCTICNKAFKWSINLKEHMAIHTGERLYSCRHCSRQFNASSNLHSHRKKVHREEWEEERKQRLEMASVE